MKAGTKKNLNRRARKILARIRKLGEKDTLLDLTPLDEQEARVFLVSEEEKIRRLATGVWEDLANSFKGIDKGIASFGMTMHAMGMGASRVILNGTKVPPQSYNLKKISSKMPWPIYKEGDIFGLRSDTLILDDPFIPAKNPLTLGEEIHTLLEKELKTK